MEIVTLENMQNFNDCYKAIEWAKSQYGEYPSRPSKPYLKHGHSSIEAKQYVIDLEDWEKTKADYDKNMIAYKGNQNAITEVIVEYIKDMAGLNTIPEQYRDKVYRQAWEDGHSSGYYEVYLKLDSLVEIFS